MAILYATGVATASNVATTINAGGTVLGVSFAGTGSTARAVSTDIVVSGPAAKLAALRNAYEANRGPAAATVAIEARAPTFADLSEEERRIAILGRMLIP